MGKKLKNWSYLGCYFTYRLHIWYHGTTQLGAFNDPSDDDLDQMTSSTVKIKKVKKTGYISDAISPTDFIFGTT